MTEAVTGDLCVHSTQFTTAMREDSPMVVIGHENHLLGVKTWAVFVDRVWLLFGDDYLSKVVVSHEGSEP